MFFFSPAGNPRAGNHLTHTGEIKPQNVRAEKLPADKLVLYTRTEVAWNLALTLHTPSSLDHTASSHDLRSALNTFPVFLVLTCFGFVCLSFAFVLPAAGFSKESRRQPAGGNDQAPKLFLLSTPIQLPDSWLATSGNRLWPLRSMN